MRASAEFIYNPSKLEFKSYINSSPNWSCRDFDSSFCACSFFSYPWTKKFPAQRHLCEQHPQYPSSVCAYRDHAPWPFLYPVLAPDPAHVQRGRLCPALFRAPFPDHAPFPFLFPAPVRDLFRFPFHVPFSALIIKNTIKKASFILI